MDEKVISSTLQACAAAQVQCDPMSLELVLSLHQRIEAGEDLTLSQISDIKTQLAIKHGFIKPDAEQ